MTENIRQSQGGESDGQMNPAIPGGGENLDKVRDILFGAQLRDSDKRFSRIEERLAKDVAELRDETRKRLDSLEAFIKKEVQSLVERAKSEQGQRTEAVKDLAQQLKDVNQQMKEAGKAIEKRLVELDDQASESNRALREQILEQSKTLRDEILGGNKGSAAAIEVAAAELRDGKADRSALVELFTEMAMRLSNETEPPARK